MLRGLLEQTSEIWPKNWLCGSMNKSLGRYRFAPIRWGNIVQEVPANVLRMIQYVEDARRELERLALREVEALGCRDIDVIDRIQHFACYDRRSAMVPLGACGVSCVRIIHQITDGCAGADSSEPLRRSQRSGSPPLGFTIARSGAESPFRLESTPLWTV